MHSWQSKIKISWALLLLANVLGLPSSLWAWQPVGFIFENIRWSPDSRYIAFDAKSAYDGFDPGFAPIIRYDTKRYIAENLTPTPSALFLSPDGKTVVLQDVTGYYVAQIENGQLGSLTQRVFTPWAMVNTYPTPLGFSPDGTFFYYRLLDTDGYFRFEVNGVDIGNEPEKIDQLPAGDLYLYPKERQNPQENPQTWPHLPEQINGSRVLDWFASPSEQKYAVITEEAYNSHHLWSVDSAGGNPFHLASSPHRFHHFVWLDDVKALWLSWSEYALWRGDFDLQTVGKIDLSSIPDWAQQTPPVPRFVIQLKSGDFWELLQAAADSLSQHGLNAWVQPSPSVLQIDDGKQHYTKNPPIFRLRCGPYVTRAEAESALADVESRHG